MGLQHVNVPGKTLLGLGSCCGSCPTWAEPARHGTRAARGGPDPKSRLLDPCRCPAVLCIWGREVTVGKLGLWQGTARAAVLHGEAQAVVRQMVLWRSSCTSPRCRAVLGAVVPRARARLPHSVLQEGGCHAQCCVCSRNGRALDG